MVQGDESGELCAVGESPRIRATQTAFGAQVLQLCSLLGSLFLLVVLFTSSSILMSVARPS